MIIVKDRGNKVNVTHRQRTYKIHEGGRRGLPGEPGEQGPVGEGVPTGGSVGQVLTKQSNADYDTDWETPEPLPGTIVQSVVAGDNMSVDNSDPANPIVSTLPSFSPATFVVAPENSGYRADYYTDGVNDQEQINAAIVAVSALPGGGTVHLKAGTYTIGNYIKVLSNTKLQGEGMLNTIIKGSGSGYSALYNRDGTTGSPLHDIEICDLKIDMEDVTKGAASSIDVKCVFITYIQRFFLHGVWSYGSIGTGVGTDFLVDSVIDRCLTEYCGRAGESGTGEYLIGCNGFGIGSGQFDNESWIISNCIAKNCGNQGFLIENLNSAVDSYNAQVVNCTAYDCANGFLTTGVSQILFSNCIADMNYRNGFYINSDDAGSTTNPKRVIMNNCMSTRNGTMGQSQGSGLYLHDYFTAGNRLKNIVINGGIFYANSNHGIRIGNSTGVSIVGCEISNNRNQGIEFEQTVANMQIKDVVITGCRIFNNSNPNLGSVTDHSGIRLNTPTAGISNVVITGNRIYDELASGKWQNYAVEIASSATITGITVTNNDMTGNKNASPFFIGSAAGIVMHGNNLGVTESVTRTGSTSFARTEKTIFYNQAVAVTATLPNPALVPQNDRRTVIDRSGTGATNNISVASAAGTVNGAATYVAVNTAYGSRTFASDGTNWYSA